MVKFLKNIIFNNIIKMSGAFYITISGDHNDSDLVLGLHPV